MTSGFRMAQSQLCIGRITITKRRMVRHDSKFQFKSDQAVYEPVSKAESGSIFGNIEISGMVPLIKLEGKNTKTKTKTSTRKLQNSDRIRSKATGLIKSIYI